MRITIASSLAHFVGWAALRGAAYANVINQERCVHVEPWKGLKEHPGQNRFLANLSYSYGLLTIQIEYRKLESSYVVMFRSPTLFRVMDEGDLLRFQSQFEGPVFASSFIFELFDTELINFVMKKEIALWTKGNIVILRLSQTTISLK